MLNTGLTQCSLHILKQRAFLLQNIRLYFNSNNVLEVETPILSSSGNTDIHIESFTSESIVKDSIKSYLRTSPEFALKRLICSGIGDVFEIGKVFRRGEISSTHNVEFTMLEWYRLNFDYKQLIADVKKLFLKLFNVFNVNHLGCEVYTYNHLFKEILSIDVTLSTAAELNLLCKKLNYTGSILTKDEALDYLFATSIQVQLNLNKLSFVTHYPASQAALAQIDSVNNEFSLRFEVFFQGHELGNGYQELTNPKELLSRFKKDNMLRTDKYIQIDKNLIYAMENGMPNCSGIAVGIDRLLMVLLKIDNISGVLSFNAKNS